MRNRGSQDGENGIFGCFIRRRLYGLERKETEQPVSDYLSGSWRCVCSKKSGIGRIMDGIMYILQRWYLFVRNQLYDPRGSWGGRRMVFCDFGTVFALERECISVMQRLVFLFFIQFGGSGALYWKKTAEFIAKCSLSSVSCTCRNIACILLKKRCEQPYRASFTIEASIVMGVVLMVLLSMIRYGCILHDQVTGAMIAEEAVIQARFLTENRKADSLQLLEEQGKTIGNPRIWLGEFFLEIREVFGVVSGVAAAGDWKLEMSIPKFRPGDFLREHEIEKGHAEEVEQDGG